MGPFFWSTPIWIFDTQIFRSEWRAEVKRGYMLETPKAPSPHYGIAKEMSSLKSEMGNQQERPMSLEALGGLITGEGSFLIGASQSQGYKRLTPIFQLKMNDRDTMESAIAGLRAAGLPTNVTMGAYPQYPDSPPWMRVRAQGIKRLKSYCETLLPYLFGSKKRAAEIVMEFCESRILDDRPVKKGRPYNSREIDLVRQLRAINGVKNGRKHDLSSWESSETTRHAPRKEGEDIVRTCGKP